MTKTIGLRIAKSRNRCGFTLEYVAENLGIARQTIFKYENGIITNIPSDRIEKLAKLFNTTPAYLMGWEEENQYITNDEYFRGVKKAPKIEDMDFSDVEIPITSKEQAIQYLKDHSVQLLGGLNIKKKKENDLIDLANQIRGYRKILRDLKD